MVRILEGYKMGTGLGEGKERGGMRVGVGRFGCREGRGWDGTEWLSYALCHITNNPPV